MNMEKQFDMASILGQIFSVNIGEVLSWFWRLEFFAFTVFVQLVLIFALPVNYSLHLSLGERLWLWPISHAIYTTIWFLGLFIGAKYAQRKLGRVYYTPVTMLAGVTVATLVFHLMIAKLRGVGFEFSIGLLWDIGVLVIWVSALEALSFYFNTRHRKNDNHDWESV